MISVVIPTFGRPHLLAHALASVARQSYPDVEVIVVNDGGPSLGPALAHWDARLRIRLVELARRSGPGAARNAGIQIAKGEYLAFLDDDDIFLSDHLARAAPALEEYDFVYGGAVVVRGARVDRLPANWAAMPLKSYPFSRAFLLVANYIHTGSVLLRNSERFLARFDTEMSQCEDWQMWLALCVNHNLRVKHIAGITTVYHQVDGEPGKVAQGYLRTPTEFSLARQRIHREFESSDPLVRAYRRWMTDFEHTRDTVIASGCPVDSSSFDRALQYLYPRFLAGEMPSTQAIGDLVDGGMDVNKLASSPAWAVPIRRAQPRPAR